MSKHILPATELDDERVVWIKPSAQWKKDGTHDGVRLRLDKLKGEIVQLLEEKVLPERVDNPNANRIVEKYANLMLTKDDAIWLRDALTELLDMGGEW